MLAASCMWYAHRYKDSSRLLRKSHGELKAACEGFMDPSRKRISRLIQVDWRELSNQAAMLSNDISELHEIKAYCQRFDSECLNAYEDELHFPNREEDKLYHQHLVKFYHAYVHGEEKKAFAEGSLFDRIERACVSDKLLNLSPCFANRAYLELSKEGKDGGSADLNKCCDLFKKSLNCSTEATLLSAALCHPVPANGLKNYVANKDKWSHETHRKVVRVLCFLAVAFQIQGNISDRDQIIEHLRVLRDASSVSGFRDTTLKSIGVAEKNIITIKLDKPWFSIKELLLHV